jgi:hypothetical protein
MHLWLNFYLSRPMFEEAQLDGSHAVIHELLPEWSSQLRVVEDEQSRDGVVVGPQGRLYDGVHQFAPPKWGLGSVTLIGANKGVSFFLSHCDGSLPPGLNEVSIEVFNRSDVEGEPVSTWARKFFECVVSQLPVRYARARTREEFAAKNMIEDERSAEAIGVDITDAIPGLYWLNYFGAPYLDLIGRDRLLSAPAHEVKPAGDGVLIGLDASPEAWQSPAYQQREQAVIAHLGEQYFFSRHDPDRQTVAPDFKAFQDRSPGN